MVDTKGVGVPLCLLRELGEQAVAYKGYALKWQVVEHGFDLRKVPATYSED